MQSEQFNELLQRAQAGEHEASERLAALLRPELEWLVREHGASLPPDSTSDIVQDAACCAFERLHQFHGGDSDDATAAMFRVWVGRIVQRLVLTKLRVRHTRKRKPPQAIVPLRTSGSTVGTDIDPGASGATPSSLVARDEEVIRVQAALDGILSHIDRQIVTLRFFEGASLRQISDKLGLSYDKVRERYRVTMRRLERQLRNTNE